MKTPLLILVLLFFFSASVYAQTSDRPLDNRFTAYAGAGLQYYNGDLGNGIYKKHRDCSWGVISFGLDYKLNKAFDLKIMGTIGAIGYMQPEERDAEIDAYHELHEGENHEHGINPDMENLSGQMFAGIIALQYNFANGCLLPLENKFAPSAYLGVGLAYFTDPMGKDCIDVGTYTTINTGVSLNYRLTSSFFVGAKFDFGFFTNDELDFVDHGRNDFHMQNSAVLGFQF